MPFPHFAAPDYGVTIRVAMFARKVKRYDAPGHPYFVTTDTLDRRPYFRDPTLAQIVVDNLDWYATRGDFELEVWVVMPDHIHLLLTPIAGGIADVMRNLKSHIASELRLAVGRSGPVWQASFHDRVIRSEAHWRQAAEYIHHNPVKAGLVQEPGDYPFSSARAWGYDRSGLGP